MSQQGYILQNPIDILTKDQVDSIKLGALNVLENTGVVFHHEKALQILMDAGCNIDKGKKLVKFSRDLVEESLGKCPSNFLLHGRDGKYGLDLGDPNVYFGSFAGKEYIDLDTYEKRLPTKKEFAAAWQILNYLSGCHVPHYTYGSVQGIDGPYWYPYRSATAARNTEKAGANWVGGIHGAHKWSIRIFEVSGVTPLGSVPATPPLTWHRNNIDVLLDCAKAGIPIKPASGLASGATGPATIAGTLVQNCAEVISAIVLAQIVKPGLGVIVQDYSQPLEMRTGGIVQGGIERGLMGAAWCQIWRNYGIPRMTMMSSDAKVPDYQCAMEKVMSVSLHALAGSNIVSFMGTVYDELIFSPAVAIIDNDVVRMLGRVLRGITVNQQSLAVDIINEVGPIPGQFLDKKHTRETWKQEQLMPDVADRLTHPEWERLGKRDILAIARDKHEEILKNHRPEPLSKEQEKEISKILEEAKKYYQGKNLF